MQYLTETIRQEPKRALKQIRIVDNEGKIIKVVNQREEMEEKII